MQYRKIVGWGKKHAGDVLRYAAIPAGALSGGITFYATGDAVAAEKAMLWPALTFMAGEAINAETYWEGNWIKKAGKVASVAAPLVGAWFLSDNSYNPALTLGMMPVWGLAKGVEELGDKIETNRYAKELLAEGEEAVTKEFAGLPVEKKAEMVAYAAKHRK